MLLAESYYSLQTACQFASASGALRPATCGQRLFIKEIIMNLEGLTLRVLVHELAKALVSGRIYKIFMPGKSSFLIQVNQISHTVNFLIDMSGDTPLITLPKKLPERPNMPPSFCMLLRKHLEEGRITQITQKDLDRVIIIDIDLIGAERKIITKKLILEMTGRNSNIIFVNEDGIILDALRHIGKAQSRVRQILPNTPYEFPPAQEGLNLLESTPHAIREACAASSAENLTGALIAVTQGIGKQTAMEIACRSGYEGAPKLMDVTAAAKIEKAIASLQEEVQARLEDKDTTVYAQIDKRNRMKNLVPYKPVIHPEMKTESFPTLLDALAYSASLIPVQIPEKDTLQKIVQAQQAKTEKKIKALAQDLARAENADAQKIKADTLMAYHYQLKKGDTTCTLNNIYDNTPLIIALAPQLTPLENAQAYYKKYNKYKRAIGEIKEQQQEAEELLQYLESLDASLDTAMTRGEIEEIKQELISIKVIPAPKKKMPAAGKSEPLKITLSEDTYLYVGKNNKQNDFVTFKLGRGHDLWFHAKNIPGSHVIMKTTLPEPREEDILKAAQIAAAFSKGKNADRVPVDYTEKRFVKKPNGAKPGFVIFTNQTTLYVKPDKEAVKS
jgi:predicted ribosome quality control (RQC) complex YloA/Tae2 family protein